MAPEEKPLAAAQAQASAFDLSACQPLSISHHRYTTQTSPPTTGWLTDVCHADNHQATLKATTQGEEARRHSHQLTQTKAGIVHHPYRSGSISQSEAACGRMGTTARSATAW